MSAKSNLVAERILKAKELLKSCCLCGHRCGVNRLEGEKGKCGAGLEIEIASYCAHHGEEPFISGGEGSGTIFFRHCNLKCVFCQNWEISQLTIGAYCNTPLHQIMLDLQSKGCHNINLVTPTHYMPQILEALQAAFNKGLEIPIVYNTNGYDSVELLKLLDGVVDVYMPDLKYFDNDKAQKYSNAENYVEVSRAGIKEILRQVGNLRFDENEIAVRGILVRHLVLPNGISDTKNALKYLSTVSRDMWISIMSQYSPQNRANEYHELNRSLTPQEYWEAVGWAQEYKLENYLIQEIDSKDAFLPDFKEENPFGSSR